MGYSLFWDNVSMFVDRELVLETNWIDLCMFEFLYAVDCYRDSVS